jgi:Ca-activated chloride channel homolog
MVLALSFAEPLALLALLAIPALVVLHAAAERRARRTAVRHPGVGVLAAVVAQGGGQSPWRRWLPLALFLTAIAVLVGALARPERTVAVTEEEASVMLVFDASRSMEAQDVPPNRLSAAREAALAFVDELPDSVRLGLVAFSDRPFEVIRPARDKDVTRASLLALQPVAGTATGDALVVALEALPRRGRRTEDGLPPAAIVLLSDGAAQQGVDPVAVARQAGRLGIPISTVALGTDEGTVPGRFGEPMPVPPDRESMRDVARLSGGQAFEVADAERLRRIYESLGASLRPKTEQRQVTSTFAGVGLLLALAGIGLGLRWNGRLTA